MRTKNIFSLLAAWLVMPMLCPACIYCVIAAQKGISADDPNGPGFNSQTAKWTPMTMPVAQANVPLVLATNIPAELPKTNPPAAVTFTNGTLVGWDVLADYGITLAPELENNTNAVLADAQVNELIPENVRALDRRKVSADGFMIPAQMENGKVTEFLLSRNPPACCYGGVPQIHEWIKVRVKAPGVEWEQYNTVRAHGVLRVGAERVDGTLTSIYRMEADQVEVTPEH